MDSEICLSMHQQLNLDSAINNIANRPLDDTNLPIWIRHLNATWSNVKATQLPLSPISTAHAIRTKRKDQAIVPQAGTPEDAISPDKYPLADLLLLVGETPSRSRLRALSKQGRAFIKTWGLYRSPEIEKKIKAREKARQSLRAMRNKILARHKDLLEERGHRQTRAIQDEQTIISLRKALRDEAAARAALEQELAGLKGETQPTVVKP